MTHGNAIYSQLLKRGLNALVRPIRYVAGSLTT